MDLSPKLLEMHGFSAAVSELVDRLNKMQLFVISVYIEPELKRFEKKHELILYRITQELLNNSIKHAACTEINLQLFYREGKLVLNYDDNGKGFNVADKMENGYGLSNIKTRASLLNGSVKWESKPGYGVNVIVEIPFSLTQ